MINRILDEFMNIPRTAARVLTYGGMRWLENRNILGLGDLLSPPGNGNGA